MKGFSIQPRILEQEPYHLMLFICYTPTLYSLYIQLIYHVRSILYYHKSYNVRTNQITIKNTHHNPLSITHNSQTNYFLNFIMTTLCSSVIIIIVHKNTNYYCNPFIIFIIYVLSQITIVYIIYTQHFI